MYNKAKKGPKQGSHWDEYKAFSEELKKELKRAHWQHINNILQTAEHDKNPNPPTLKAIAL